MLFVILVNGVNGVNGNIQSGHKKKKNCRSLDVDGRFMQCVELVMGMSAWNDS